MRIVEKIAEPDIKEGPPARLSGQAWDTLARVQEEANDRYEWWSLAGAEDSLDYEGFETRSEYRLGTERVRREEALAERVSSDAYLRRRLDDYLVAEELAHTYDDMNQIGFWHDSDLDLLMRTWNREGPEFGRFLLNSMPTEACIFTVRSAKHSNPQWKWQQHDQTDMAALATAVPYCDIVVTERQWSHVFRAAQLDRRYNTRIFSRLSDLVALLD
jgi:hypothetical protein